MRSFLDTNVLVYAFDTDAGEKQTRAQRLMEVEAAEGRLVLSTQVLQEFYVAVTRKLARPLSAGEAEAAVREFALLPVIQVDVEMVVASIARSRSAGFSLWDSLIVEAALAGGATRLYTEDLQHGQRISEMEIVNPFMEPGAG